MSHTGLGLREVPLYKGTLGAWDLGLTLVQHNSLGSWDVFLSLFSSLSKGPPVDLGLLQDPPSSKGFLPCYAGFKSFAPPVARPRVAC